MERSQLCPEEIELKPNLCTGVAFDNFDRYVDTHTGKNTLHDTVGIIYQNIDNTLNSETNMDTDETDSNSDETDCNTLALNKKRKRRIVFDAYIPELPACIKRPRVTEVLLSKNDELRQISPLNLLSIHQIDL